MTVNEKHFLNAYFLLPRTGWYIILKYVPVCFSLKLECEKLASEKIEIQRHYVMVSCTFHFCVERTHGHTTNTTISHLDNANLNFAI